MSLIVTTPKIKIKGCISGSVTVSCGCEKKHTSGIWIGDIISDRENIKHDAVVPDSGWVHLKSCTLYCFPMWSVKTATCSEKIYHCDLSTSSYIFKFLFYRSMMSDINETEKVYPQKKIVRRKKS